MSIALLLLLVVCVFVTVYDFRYRKVPNWVTLPLVSMGVIINFPGTLTLWMVSILLIMAWGADWMGGGDVKLWIGLLWCTYSFLGESVAVIMFVVMIVTSVVQILVRLLAKQKAVGVKVPGAWRALAYVIFLIIYSSGVVHHVHF